MRVCVSVCVQKHGATNQSVLEGLVGSQTEDDSEEWAQVSTHRHTHTHTRTHARRFVLAGIMTEPPIHVSSPEHNNMRTHTQVVTQQGASVCF